jgi:hypothetical protein
LLHAGAITIFEGRRGRIFQTLNSATPQAQAAYGAGIITGDFDSDGLATVVAGTPNQSANLDEETGVFPHLQIGQIEIQP